MNKVELLRLAKELSGETNIDMLMRHAEDLKEYLFQKDKIHDSLQLKRPSDLANFVRIENPELGTIDLDLYDFQKDMMDVMNLKNKYVIIQAARQMGTTMLLCLYALHQSITRPGIKTLICSTSLASSIHKINMMMGMLGSSKADLIKIDSSNKNSITLSNGSVIKGIEPSANRFRGVSLDLVIFDNFDFFPNVKSEEILSCLIPAISGSSESKIIMTGGFQIDSSTPMHRIINQDGLSKSHIMVPYSLHPERDAVWAERTLEGMDASAFVKQYGRL